MPSPKPLRLFFDYVDPASWLLEKGIRGRLVGEEGICLVLTPFEICPPPQPLHPPDNPELALDWDRFQKEGRVFGVELKRPWIVPWSRKAHELAFHAKANGCFQEIHDAIFRAYFEGGQDIGRVDILVEVAREGGLDPVQAKAVLDVDRFRSEVEGCRMEGLGAGVTRAPTLLAGNESLVGYPDAGVLDEFLTTFINKNQP